MKVIIITKTSNNMFNFVKNMKIEDNTITVDYVYDSTDFTKSFDMEEVLSVTAFPTVIPGGMFKE